MNQPATIYDVLEMLADYHRQRAKRYEKLGETSDDAMAQILLEHLVELENQSTQCIDAEMQTLAPEAATYLISGPRMSQDALHAADCQCEQQPSFSDALACAFTSDQRLDELLDRMEDCTAAQSVIDLAKRLRDLEHLKYQRIAKFSRQD